ncbi:branched chain amino acid ABC transporter substrate-binding protein [Labrys miyagiensis]|uniref:Branched chain amino acid ABC transporter substrate-binding protein n=1 Tax=Labrys miyagiensis TaxID=346912 RepID=A0ABQ6CUA1_9HYPH|nr:branched-chain amino acid ABC transporter substrate-binding protein [Labrys miyagiensis]GLS23705.1 branched chain amino acid ABC transporter substrate-binding protein [Labrys miyagiensis]
MKKLLLTSVALAAALAFAGAAQAQIKLGVAGPITGPNAPFGAQLKNGVDMAAKNINAAGGILGQKLEVEVGDDQSDPKQGVSVANKFVGDGVTMVVGHFNSGVTIPASEVYADNGVIMITPSATNEKVTDRGLWNVFRTCGRDDQQAQVWSDYFVANYKGKNVAVIDDKTTYGAGLAKNAVADLEKAGITPGLIEEVNIGEKDYSAVVTKMKGQGTDVLIWGGLYTEAALILKQLRDQGMKTVMLSGDGITSADFATIGGDAVIGTQMTFPPKVEANPANADLVKQFKAIGYTPEGYTLFSYAAVEIFKQAAEAAKSVDPQKMAEQMHTGMPFHTVMGDLAYDKKGDLTKVGYVMYTWKKGDDGKIDYFQNPS